MDQNPSKGMGAVMSQNHRLVADCNRLVAAIPAVRGSSTSAIHYTSHAILDKSVPPGRADTRGLYSLSD